MLVPDVNAKNHDDPAVKEAREIVENIINQQVDYRETPAPRYNNNNKGDYSTKELNSMSSAWDISNEMASGNFKNADNDRYKFRENADNSTSVIDRKNGQVLVTVELGSMDASKNFAPYTGQFTPGKEMTEWDYINNLQTNTPDFNISTETNDFKLSTGSQEITKISELNTQNTKDARAALEGMRKLIGSYFPTLENIEEKVTFKSYREGGENYTSIFIDGKPLLDSNNTPLSFITGVKDASEGSGSFNNNKRVIEEAINAIKNSLSVNTNAAP
jgi:hypothetical protein